MLNCNNITKSYHNLQVLKGINLTIQKAEMVSIIGESGAGKSTLLHILGTLDKPDQGELTIAGTDILSLKKNKLSAFRNSKIGFVFQFHQLMPEFTALENACLPAWIAGYSKKDSIKSAMELFDYLGIADRAHHFPKQLSGGEQQRVAVARALINKPQIVLADEPTGNLDSKNTELLHSYFLKLQKDFALTFLIVTHNLELAKSADRMLLMKDGYLES